MKIKDRTNLEFFPEDFGHQIISIRESMKPIDMGFVTKFTEYREGLVEDAGCFNVIRYSNSVKIFLASCLKATDNFKKSTELAMFVRRHAQEKGLAKASVIHYLSTLSSFLDFLDVHCRKEFPYITDVPWEKVIKEVRLPFQKSSHKEKRKMQKEKFLKVPSLQEVQMLHKLVVEKLREDIKSQTLSYKDLMVFNMFLLTVRINCRSGPLLSLSWSDVEKIKEQGFIETDKHKTEYAYEITLTIQNEQFCWLERLKSQHFLEFGVNSEMVFPSSSNGVEHSYARFLRQVLRSHFPQVSSDKDFHSNSLRKMWATHMNKHRDQLPDSLRRMHLKQTGHTESTSQSNCIVPDEGNPIVQVYHTYLTSDREEPEFESFARSPHASKTPETPAKMNTAESSVTPQPSSTKKKSVTPKQSTIKQRATPETPATAKFRQSRQRKKINCRESSDEDVVFGKDPEWKPMDSSDEEQNESLSVSNISVSSAGSSKPVRRDSNVRAQYVKSLKSFRTYNPSSAEQELMKLFHNFEGQFTKKAFNRIASEVSHLLTRQQLTRSYQKIKWATNQYL